MALQPSVSSQAKTTVVSRPLSYAHTIYIAQDPDQKEIPCVFWGNQHPCIAGHAFPYPTGIGQRGGTPISFSCETSSTPAFVSEHQPASCENNSQPWPRPRDLCCELRSHAAEHVFPQDAAPQLEMTCSLSCCLSFWYLAAGWGTSDLSPHCRNSHKKPEHWLLGLQRNCCSSHVGLINGKFFSGCGLTKTLYTVAGSGKRRGTEFIPHSPTADSNKQQAY